MEADGPKPSPKKNLLKLCNVGTWAVAVNAGASHASIGWLATRIGKSRAGPNSTGSDCSTSSQEKQPLEVYRKNCFGRKPRRAQGYNGVIVFPCDLCGS